MEVARFARKIAGRKVVARQGLDGKCFRAGSAIADGVEYEPIEVANESIGVAFKLFLQGIEIEYFSPSLFLLVS